MIKVLHISPTYFSPKSVVGGGERYAFELAKAMSRSADVTFLSFSPRPQAYLQDALKVLLIPRWASLDFVRQIRRAEVIHCHQIRYPQTDAAIILGKLMGKKVFVTDLGGGCSRVLSDHLPLRGCADGYLFISHYSKQLAREWPKAKRPDFLEVIYGGVDNGKFKPDSANRKTNKIVYVGRIVSHKGIEYLIEALPDGMELEILGAVYDEDYFNYLKEKARGKNICFTHDAADEQIIRKYQEAMLAVQPSVHEDYLGRKTQAPELLGLVALEAMACGTPVVVTDAGSLPELVKDGETGFIVPQRSSAAIKEKIQYAAAHAEEVKRMGANARLHVLSQFSWEAVVSRCLQCYARK